MLEYSDLWFLSIFKEFNPLSANPTKWSNTLEQIVAILPTNCLNVFDHFVKLAVKGLRAFYHQIFHKQVEGQIRYEFAFRNWGSGVHTKSNKLPFEMFFLLM